VSFERIAPKYTEIDGVRYGVCPLPSMKALKLKARLGRIFAPAIARLVSDDPGGAADAFFGALTDKEIDDLTRELLAMATADEIPLFGPNGCFDMHFAGRTDAVEKLLKFAVAEVNYAGFFAEFGTAIRKAVESLAAGASTSPKTSPSAGRPSRSSTPGGAP
jgi:hypothetical protein